MNVQNTAQNVSKLAAPFAKIKSKLAVAAIGLATASGFTANVQASNMIELNQAAPHAKMNKTAMLVVAAVGLAAALDVTAGSDSTFTTIVTNLDDWMTGSLGKVFALGALGTGLAIGVVKQSVMSVVTGVAVALSASVGPGVLTNIFTATL
ncbi:TraA family conjugative transfer protein [Pseudomonas sp. PS02290]|uniref:TraA family conjugative transfer protein n=2 Tax=unclassified Pseudomonas TaxID=196821 RepID=UPI001E30ED91|nr:TraA family conjugative transfer protein [Pseudomonas sp. PS02290]